MHSSTSSSSEASSAGLKASGVLLAMIAVILTGSELVCRYVIPKVSKIERRISNEYREARQILRGKKPAPQVLVAGNSLLGHGVNFSQASKLLQPEVDAKRLLIEDTSYYDWYYGLRRLLREGSQPNIVVLMIRPNQFLSPKTRGDYFAFRLMQLTDLLRVQRDLKLSNTEASNLAFANLSAFCGFKTTLRTITAANIFPDLPGLMGVLNRRRPSTLTEDQILEICRERLKKLNQVATEGNSKLVLVIPPAAGKEGNLLETSMLRKAAQELQVPMLVPVDDGELSPEHFSDGFHLTPKGATVFTKRFAETLKQELVGKLPQS